VFGSLGAPELVAIFVLALLLFGPKKLPELGRALGRSFAEFRRATTDLKGTFERELVEADRPPVISPPPGQAVARTPAEPVTSNEKSVGTEPV